MRIRTGLTGIEGKCSTCNEWKPANTHNFYYSTVMNRRIQAVGEASAYDFEVRRLANRYNGAVNCDAFRSQCRSCESIRQRVRRSNPTTANRSQRRSGRAFGVELELTGPSAAAIQRAVEPITGPLIMRGYAPTNGNSWELKHDGSVSGYGHELVSPKLYGNAGLEQLTQVLYALQSVGATVDRTAGTHVHIDFRGVSFAAARSQIMGLLINQDVMLNMVAPSRRNGGYNPSWRQHQIDELRNMDAATDLRTAHLGPRGTVNLGSYPRHGSIEFRSHGGTTSAAKLTAWIRFLMAALSAASDTRYATVAEWTTALGLSREDRNQLTRFERAATEAQRSMETREYAGSGR